MKLFSRTFLVFVAVTLFASAGASAQTFVCLSLECQVARGDILVADGAFVVRVHPTSGERTLVSGNFPGLPLVGTGPDLVGVDDIALEPSGDIVATNNAADNVIRIDPATGDRVIVSGCADNSGSAGCPILGAGDEVFLNVKGIAVEANGNILVLDLRNGSDPILFRLNPVTGDRTIVASSTDGNGFFRGGSPLTLEADGSVLFYTGPFGGALLRIDPVTGDRTVVSQSLGFGGVNAGVDFANVTQIAVEADGNILVTQFSGSLRATGVLRVDPVTGDRLLVSGCEEDFGGTCINRVGAGPDFMSPAGLGIESDGNVIVSDVSAIIRVDIATGNRTVVSTGATSGRVAIIPGPLSPTDVVYSNLGPGDSWSDTNGWSRPVLCTPTDCPNSPGAISAAFSFVAGITTTLNSVELAISDISDPFDQRPGQTPFHVAIYANTQSADPGTGMLVDAPGELLGFETTTMPENRSCDPATDPNCLPFFLTRLDSLTIVDFSHLNIGINRDERYWIGVHPADPQEKIDGAWWWNYLESGVASRVWFSGGGGIVDFSDVAVGGGFQGSGVQIESAFRVNGAPVFDPDGDGVLDPDDNCPTIFNPDQLDSNDDGFGDACVPPDTVFGSGVSIGSNPVIGLGTVIRRNTMIGDNVTLGMSVVIAKNSTLGDNVSIGNQSTIRKDAEIGNNVSIGANVTVAKNAQIGDDVQIGDGTIIRKNVVIGAGAIIGNDVTIRKGATITAGAVVPDGTDVPKNSTFPP